MHSQDREIKDLQKKLKQSEDAVKEACGREAALKKRNEELRSSKEELLKGVKARDEVNLQYVERLLAAEKLLAKSDKAGGEFEALQARLKKDRGAKFNCLIEKSIDFLMEFLQGEQS